MTDRSSTKVLANGAIRYGVYDENGAFLRYEYMKLEDEPTQAGDPLNKNTLLKDTTAGALGLTTDAVVDDAFIALYIGGGKYGFQITLLYPNGTPIAGKTISGLTTVAGAAAVTDANGKVLGVATTATPTVSVTFNYIDLQSQSKVLTSTSKITAVTWTVSAQPANTVVAITSSVNNKVFSPLVKDFDVFVMGGGGHGTYGGGSGGAAGQGANYYNIPNTGASYNVTIGAGGSPGGSTSFGGYTAAGGTTTNYSNGGNGGASETAGGDTTIYPFGLTQYPVGGGGGGGRYNIAASSPGGKPYGGSGGGCSSQGNVNGTSATGYGGGGGGGGNSRDFGTTPAGSGYQGVCYIRWRYKP